MKYFSEGRISREWPETLGLPNVKGTLIYTFSKNNLKKSAVKFVETIYSSYVCTVEIKQV